MALRHVLRGCFFWLCLLILLTSALDMLFLQCREVLVKPGDLVKTTCFGPNRTVGEVGLIVGEHPRIIRCWLVLFNGVKHVIAQDGLEVVNESR